jgi:hypothetical protein
MDQKRTINELYTLYSLESGIRDIFVEGVADKSFFDWYLRQKEWRDISIYPVDLVELSDDLLQTYSLALRSNRSRVVALSLELSRLLREPKRVMCIVDRDSDEQVADDTPNPFIFYTDGNSLELYALTPAVVEKFLLVTLGGFPLSADNLITQMLTVLQRLFAIRQANSELGWGMKCVPFCSFVEVDGACLTFRERDFIRSYLQKNNKWSSRDAFLQAVEHAFEYINPDIRRTVRGHDLSELLRLVILRNDRTHIFGNTETVERCLMTAIESKDLHEQALFVSIRERMTT